MKKLLVYLTMIVMMFSFTACNEKVNNFDEERRDNVQKEGESTSEYLKQDIKESVSGAEVVDNSDKAENVSIEEEVDTYVPYILHEQGEYKHFTQDGYWYFAADSDGKNNMKWFAYDINNKKIINKDGWEPSTWQSKAVSGSSIIIQEIDQNGEHNPWGAQLVDMVTGETMVKLNNNQRFVGNWENGKSFVLEVTESLDKNTYSMGMINNKGEWVYPFSSEYPWLDSNMGIDEVVRLFEKYISCAEGVYLFEEYLFDSKNNQIFIFPENEYIGIWGVGFDGFLLSYFEDGAIGSFNTTRGEWVELSRSTSGIRQQWFNGGLLVLMQDNTVQVKYVDGSTIMQCDMSSYHNWEVQGVTKNNLLFTYENESGTEYICLMNADGSMGFEPKKVCDVTNGALYDSRIYLSNKNLIIDSGGMCFVYDMSTGEMVNQDVSYYILEYFSEVDMFLVSASHPELETNKRYCYLVNIDNLDTLISPFDINAKKQNVEKTQKLSNRDLIRQIIGKYTDGDVFYHVVINQMSEGIEAFALTEEIFDIDDEGYADIIQSNENYGDEIHRLAGWYINGNTAKRVFLSSDEGKGEGYIPTWLNQEDIGVGLCPPLKDGTQLIQVEWSISYHNSGSVFYELAENDVTYAFSGSDMMYITDDGSIIVFDYYYDSFTETGVSSYWEYVYENKELKLVNSWEEYD